MMLDDIYRFKPGWCYRAESSKSTRSPNTMQHKCMKSPNKQFNSQNCIINSQNTILIIIYKHYLIGYTYMHACKSSDKFLSLLFLYKYLIALMFLCVFIQTN